MKDGVIFIIKIYRRFGWFVRALFAGFGVPQTNVCVFQPSCSKYTKQAIERYGIVKGVCKGGYRILRCHPWQKPQQDELR